MHPCALHVLRTGIAKLWAGRSGGPVGVFGEKTRRDPRVVWSRFFLSSSSSLSLHVARGPNVARGCPPRYRVLGLLTHPHACMPTPLVCATDCLVHGGGHNAHRWLRDRLPQSASMLLFGWLACFFIACLVRTSRSRVAEDTQKARVQPHTLEASATGALTTGLIVAGRRMWACHAPDVCASTRPAPLGPRRGVAHTHRQSPH